MPQIKTTLIITLSAGSVSAWSSSGLLPFPSSSTTKKSKKWKSTRKAPPHPILPSLLKVFLKISLKNSFLINSKFMNKKSISSPTYPSPKRNPSTSKSSTKEKLSWLRNLISKIKNYKNSNKKTPKWNNNWPSGLFKDSPVTLSAKPKNKWTLSTKNSKKILRPRRKEWPIWVSKWKQKWTNKTANKTQCSLWLSTRT